VGRQVRSRASCRARASARLAAGGMSRCHWITVIRVKRAEQSAPLACGRSSAAQLGQVRPTESNRSSRPRATAAVRSAAPSLA
jgi:hypothetical protein